MVPTAENRAPSCFGWALFNWNAYSRYAHRFLLAYCLSAALSIAAAQTILLLLIASWVITVVCSGSFVDLNSRKLKVPLSIAAPMFSWFLIGAVTAVSGIEPLRSLLEVFRSSVFLLLPFAVLCSFFPQESGKLDLLGRLESYIAAVLLGQSIAAMHTVLCVLGNYQIPMLLPGAVTESGQLVLVIPLLLASTFYALSTDALKNQLNVSLFGVRVSPQLYAGVFFMTLLVIAWPGTILLDDASFGTVVFRLLALVGVLLLAIPPLRRGAPSIRDKIGRASKTLHVELFQLLWPAAALLFAALLINLKRGPWLGVFVELLVLGYFLSKRLMFWSVAVTFFVLLTLSPARMRVENFDEHFAISGGRQEMWNLGFEIIQRYPLGVGIHNARFMRELDPAIPHTHRHMHNNLLNVAVETGWIGLGVYLWWMFSLLRLAFSMWNNSRNGKDRISKQVGVISLCLGVALLGWQVAGLVEYNFGDGEIRLIALFYMGLLLTIQTVIMKESQ